LVAASAYAAERPFGEREYLGRCAMCHGVAGKGDGWMVEYLKKRPPSLAVIKKNNGGVFPFDRLYQIIDGRKEVQMHGPRDMPVWGGVYRVETDTTYDAYFGQYYPDEARVRARILALIDYISRFQE
jgi:mono/diheme cytochrome c family protein